MNSRIPLMANSFITFSSLTEILENDIVTFYFTNEKWDWNYMFIIKAIKLGCNITSFVLSNIVYILIKCNIITTTPKRDIETLEINA